MVRLLWVWLSVGAALGAQTVADWSAVDRLLGEASTKLNTGLHLHLTQHGETIYRKTFGPLDPTKPVPIASGSKWLAGAVVMTQVGDGKMDLRAPLSQWLDFLRPEKAGITLGQAFSHTAGFRTESALHPTTPCMADRRTTLDACAREIARIPLENPPGTAFAYTSLSMQLAGRAVEIAAGRSFVRLFQERLTGPLGMTQTLAAPPGAEGNPLIPAGFTSTAEDYTRFLRMLLDGGVWEGRRVLPAWAVYEMLADQTRGARIVYSPYQDYEALRPGIGEIRYGVGGWVERTAGGVTREFSSQGAFGFSPWVDLERNLTGVLMVEDDFAWVQLYYFRLKALLASLIPVARVTTIGVVNAASFQPGALCARQLVTIFGVNIGPETGVVGEQGAGGEYPETLGGVRVLLDGEGAPLLFVSSGQVTFQTPASIRDKVSVRLEVEWKGERTPPLRLPVEETAPGLFTMDASGRGLAAALEYAGAVALFGTGGGMGEAVPVQAQIGGRAAEVLYFGPAPGLSEGVFQINLRIPLGLAPGTYEVQIRLGEAVTQAGVMVRVR